MLFLSQLLGAKVTDSAGKGHGTIRDIIATHSSSYPEISALVIKNSSVTSAIPISFIEDIVGREVHLNTTDNKLIPYNNQKSDIHLRRDVLDKQIVDVKGIRVVRVNDLHIRKVGAAYRIIGFDVSMKGLLRRLGIGVHDGASRFKGRYIEWKDIHLVNTSVPYIQLVKPSAELVTLHPSDIANIVEDLNLHQAVGFVGQLDKDIAAKVVEELNPEAQKKIFPRLKIEDQITVLARMSSNEIADILRTVSREKARELLAKFPEEDALRVKMLLRYDEESAGGIMHLEFLSVPETYTALQVKEFVKQESVRFGSLFYIYVTDGASETSRVPTQGSLKGVISLRALLTADDSKTAREVMKSRVRTAKTGDDYMDVAKFMTKYNLFCVAVSDNKGRILGVINVDDIMRLLVPQA